MKRRLLFAALYLSEGAPIGYLWWALPTRLREAGVSTPEIASLAALLALPWSLKFLWAPVVDVLHGPRWSLKAWVAASQLLMGLLLLALLGLDLQADYRLVVVVCLAHAAAAATQDVAVDALAIGSAAPEERGGLNGWMQAGMLLGRSVFGGGALLLERWVGGDGVILLLVAAVWGSLGFLLMSPIDEADRPERPLREFGETLRHALSEKGTWLGFGFALLGGAGFEAVGAVAGPFLLDRGLTREGVGWFLALPAVGAMTAGALAGGRLSDRIERPRAAVWALTATATVILSLAAADWLGASTPRLALLGALYLCIGIFTAASYALFMDLTSPRLAATQFSAYMGVTNACESWSAFLAGRLIAGWGYPPAFAAAALLSLSALPLLRLMRR